MSKTYLEILREKLGEQPAAQVQLPATAVQVSLQSERGRPAQVTSIAVPPCTIIWRHGMSRLAL